MIPLEPQPKVEADSDRHYVAVNDAACELLGYSRNELLQMKIDDISFPSGAHARPMYDQFMEDGSMRGVFALRRKTGEAIWIRFTATNMDGRFLATWTHYEPWDPAKPEPDLNAIV